MRVYWYWPFLRSEDVGLADAVARGPVDHLLVHTLDRPGVPHAAASDRVELRGDLPEVGAAHTGARWFRDRLRTYAARRRLRDAEIRRGHDVDHIWFLNRFTDVVDVPRLARRGALVVNVHDVRPHASRLPGLVDHGLLRRIYRSDAHLVVHHPVLADRLGTDFGVDRARVHVVPHMVRVREPTPFASRAGNRVLFFGTFRANKGMDVLLDAIGRADPAIAWEIMGRGDAALEAAVRAAAKTNDALDVRIGHADEQAKAAAFDRADLVVMPYTAFESQSGVLHDAYAHGVPVVVTDVGALGSMVREDGTGAVIEPRDPDALLAAVTTLLGDAVARAGHGEAAARAGRDRSPANIATRLHELYAGIT